MNAESFPYFGLSSNLVTFVADKHDIWRSFEDFNKQRKNVSGNFYVVHCFGYQPQMKYTKKMFSLHPQKGLLKSCSHSCDSIPPSLGSGETV